jgi:hypothetical protein
MDAITLIRLALEVLSDRLMAILGLTMSFILACWTMSDPTLERLGMSAFFAMFSYLIVKIKEKNDVRPEGT